MGNELAKLEQRIFGASTRIQEQMMGLLKAMATREGSQQAAIRQAVNKATFGEVEHGANVMGGIKILGKSVYEKYKDCPFILAGLAYTAGIAEGKQLERNRRRHAAILKAVKETGHIPPEYME